MTVEEIGRGFTVYSEDGKRIGDVVEVHAHYLLVSRGLLVVRDVYVPRYAVAAVEERKVRLAITEERLRKMGWTSPPPPPPPPVNSAVPRLVPSLQPEEPAPPAQPGPADDTAGYVTYPGIDTVADDDALASDLAADAAIFDDYEDMGITFGASVEVDGGAYLAVQRLGPPPEEAAPAVVFVHGWGFDHRVWDYLTLDLPGTYTVVTYDARGYGRSTAPWTGYDLGQASRDLRVLLRTLDLTGATLVGLDVGAAAALHYVLSGGRRAGRLVLIAPTVAPTGDMSAPVVPPGGRPVPAGPSDSPAAWREELRRDRPRLASHLSELWAPGVSPETHAWLRESLLAAAPHALLHGLDALAAPDLEHPLEQVGLPTLVLHGRHDPVVPLSHGEAVAAAIPGARLVVLDAPGHLPMIADPQRVLAEVRGALEAADGAAAEAGETPLLDEALPAKGTTAGEATGPSE